MAHVYITYITSIIWLQVDCLKIVFPTLVRIELGVMISLRESVNFAGYI